MFSSHSKKAYQQIDDDYDDTPLRANSCTTRFLDGMQSGRNLIFGAASDEQQSLIPGTSNNAYHQEDSPINDQPMDDHFTLQGPPAMASSAQLGSRRWDHIENLDEFFTHIYEYHQNGGYMCIILKKVFSLLQFIFIISFTTFFTQCINYDFLFANSNVTTHGNVNIGKRHFQDAIVDQCASHLSIWAIIAILASVIYWITRVVKHTHYIIKMSDIQQFYKHELKIEDNELLNMTWHAIVEETCKVQPRLHLMIHTEKMTSIDVYHRILRYKNYMIAMINKRVFQPVFHVPILGDIAYLPNNLKAEIEKMLFISTTGPWDGPNLREEYKNLDTLDLVTKRLKDDCWFYGMVSLVLMPLMLPFQVLESCFSLIELVKRRPDGLGMRRYSNYGRYLVRHFNELDHELNARLNRSHPYANLYMNQFYSPVLEIVAKNVTFIAAAICGVFAALSAWDEDVLQVEHILTVMTVATVVIVVFTGMIPDENLVWQPEVYMTRVVSELHYLPPDWKGRAHTAQIRHEFEQLFQMKWMFFLLELTSPIFTPFVLLFWVRPRCNEIVRFLHDYTERVDGMGDICSFALMDVGRHGDPMWNKCGADGKEAQEQRQLITSHNRALDGKTELSALHFKATNPNWKPPRDTVSFLERFKTRLGHDASMLAPLTTNLVPINELQVEGNVLLDSVYSIAPAMYRGGALPGRHPLMGEGLHRIDGPVENMMPMRQAGQGQSGGTSSGLIASLYQDQPKAAESLTNSLRASGIDVDGAGAEMRIQALFLRGLHDESRIMQSRVPNYGSSLIIGRDSDSIYAMPEGFGGSRAVAGGRRVIEDSLIDIESGPSSSGNNGGGVNRGLSDMGIASSAMSSVNIPRSRLIMRNETGEEVGRHDQIQEEEAGEIEESDDDEDNGPPVSFRA